MVEVLIPIVFFGFLASVILVPVWLRERTKQSAHDLIAKALEKGQALDSKMMDDLTQARPRWRRTLGSGVVLLALAAGFVVASFLRNDFDPSGHAQDGLMVAAVILGALGVAFTTLGIIDYSAKTKA